MMDSLIGFLKFFFKYRSKVINLIMLYVSMICAVTVLVEFGYVTNPVLAADLKKAVTLMFYGLFFLEVFRTVSSVLILGKINVSHYSGVVIIVYFLLIILARSFDVDWLVYFKREEWMFLGIVFIFLTELSKSSLVFDNFYFNPTILFVISFIGLIMVGAVLLMLPRATLISRLSFSDAIFMSTSAVCITGLTITDISTNFSMFGQTIIMVLIQVGGLGIMTFTGFFGYFFSGGLSFKNQLMFGEILDENKLNSVINTLLTIIFITFLFEFIGAVFIYFSLDASMFEEEEDRIFFAAFHAISSFCNSGFSILKDGIANEGYRYNYNFQIALTLIFILGGLGFSTVYNFYTFLKNKLKSILFLIFRKEVKYKAQYFMFNTKFIVVCNAIVLVLITVSYFILEQKHTLLQDDTLYGEWVTSFFMANASRSAGFNSVSMGMLGAPTLIMITTLMWIGSSPGSTGGGVKVTTVALAFLNIFALARGKESIEIFKRRIALESINKAFAIIVLSVVVITFSFVLLTFSDGDKSMKALLFETVSAYTTCGLSLGITPSLSIMGKYVIIFTMFVGRVGTLTLLIALIKNTRNKSYVYPTEKLLF